MKIYAIGDLHLSFKNIVTPDKWTDVEEYKPMGIFGDKWFEHYRKIYSNWKSIVAEDDIVLIPGDISWATTLEELKPDIEYIKMLPGRKVFTRGNHDYWWQSINKLRSILPHDFYLIQNDSKRFIDYFIAGSRGWTAPNDYQYTEHDQKIFDRELIRLELSLKTIKESKNIIVMLHYMPVNEKHQRNKLIELLIEHNVDICLYGHLHGDGAHECRLEGTKWGIEFHLVSSDFLDFKPELILDN